MFKIGYDKKITMVQGDTGVIRMRISNHELSQGDEVRFAIVNKANPSILLCQHSDKKIVLEKQVTVFEKDGSARIVIYPYDTEYLQPGKYLYEIQVKTKDGRIDTVVPLTSFTLMDGSIQGEYGQTTPSKPEPTPSEIELRFKRLENEIIPELGTRITNVEKEIDSINPSLENMVHKHKTIYVRDFGAKGDGVTNDLHSIQKAIDSAKDDEVTTIVFNSGDVYYLESEYNDTTDSTSYKRRVEDGIVIKSNIILNGNGTTIKCSDDLAYVFTQHTIGNTIIDSSNCAKNIIIEGFKFIKSPTTWKSNREWFTHINIEHCEVLKIRDCEFNGFNGDCIMLGFMWGGNDHDVFKPTHIKNVIIDNCIFDGIVKENRNAISVCTADNLKITNCEFRNMSKSTMPGAIDFEPERNAISGLDYAKTHKVTNIFIENNKFTNIGGNVGSIAFVLHQQMEIPPSNIHIVNNLFDNVTRPYFVSGKNGLDSGINNLNTIFVQNNKVTNSKYLFSFNNVFNLDFSNNNYWNCKGTGFINQTDFGECNSKLINIKNNVFNRVYTTNNKPCIEIAGENNKNIFVEGNKFIDTVLKDHDGFYRFRVINFTTNSIEGFLYKDNYTHYTGDITLSTLDTIEINSPSDFLYPKTVIIDNNITSGVKMIATQFTKCNYINMNTMSDEVNQANIYNDDSKPSEIKLGITSTTCWINSQKSTLITFKPSRTSNDRLNIIQFRFTSDGTDKMFIRFGTLDNSWTSWKTYTGV